MTEEKIPFKVRYSERLQAIGLVELPNAAFCITPKLVAVVYNTTGGEVYYTNDRRQFYSYTLDYDKINERVNSKFIDMIIANPNVSEYIVDADDSFVNWLTEFYSKALRERRIREVRRALENEYEKVKRQLKTRRACDELYSFICRLEETDIDAASAAFQAKLTEVLAKDKDYYNEELEMENKKLKEEIAKLEEEIKRLRRELIEREIEDYDEDDDC